ncbi:MAG: hypothetical protein A2Y07_02045 [Planctomycetes bacterium GWF2_50_10]|nr:MAG: hypothetical protein A2Y07_02045 [Planctomycetes bacterium GWF2_50_10]
MMDKAAIGAAVALSKHAGYVFIATVGPERVPHLAAAGPLLLEDNQVAITAWYCPVTLANIQQFPEVSIVVWQKETDSGYQLIGKLEKVRDVAQIDGYAPKEDVSLYPQVERQLVIKIDSVLFFSQALHADTAE